MIGWAIVCSVADGEGHERDQLAGTSDRVVVTTTRRVAVGLTTSIAVALLMMTTWGGSRPALLLRAIVLGLAGTAVFSLVEAWPRRRPRWIERWALQVVAVGVAMPITTLLMYLLSTPQDAAPFWESPARFSATPAASPPMPAPTMTASVI